MARQAVLNAALKLATVDYSASTGKLEVKSTAAEVSTTNMASGGAEEYVPGVFSGTLSVDWIFDSDNVLADALWTAHSTRAAVAFEAWQATTTTGATNPKYSGTIYILEYLGVMGAVGEARKQSATYKVSGTLSRATS
jgi:hypothetical protein